MPRTPLLGAILRLSSAVWLVTGFALAEEATPPKKPDEPATTPSSPEPVRFDEKTHFSLSWVRLPGAEDCVTGKKLSRAVEARLHRPALGAPAQSDVAIEGFIEKTEDGTFHAVVTITDAHGKLIGKRELEEASCHDMDDSLALAIALMIDPDAAFSATAAAAPARPRERPPAPPAPAPKPPKPLPSFGGSLSAGVAFGFGNMPETAIGLWLIGAVTPPTFFPIEVGAHFFPDQTVTPSPGIRVGFSRATADVFLCPLGMRESFVEASACAGVEAGTLTAHGVGVGGLEDHREAVVDAAARGHLDVYFLHRFALRIMPALGVPLIRDYFLFRQNGQDSQVFRLPAVYGEASVGFGVKLP